MSHEQQFIPEQRQPLPDEIIILNGIAGVRGSKGKFYPITLDMGVRVVADQNGDPKFESLAPSAPGTDSTVRRSRTLGEDMCPDTIGPDNELARFLIDNAGDTI